MRRLLDGAGPFFVLAGAMHFLTPKTYEAIMPPWLPAHRELVYASGVAEAIGGAGLLASHPRVRRYAGRFEALTMLAVFPANIHMALNPQRYKKVPGGQKALVARLPLQTGFLAWALAAGRR